MKQERGARTIMHELCIEEYIRERAVVNEG